MNSMMAHAMYANVVGAILSALALIMTTRLVKYEGFSVSTVTGIVLASTGTLLWFAGFTNTFQEIVKGG